MSIRRRDGIVVAASAAAAVVVASAITGSALAPSPPSSVELAPVVAAWPDSYDVRGTKAEPLYTELIHVARDGDRFEVTIDVRGQGDAELGTQHGAVRVDPDGRITWTDGCGKSAALCADDTALRGFLATAAVLGLSRDGRLPAVGELRELHGTPVICIDDEALHPDAGPAAVALDPCFERSSGAVVAHWSPDSAAFVGATLADGFTVTTGTPSS